MPRVGTGRKGTGKTVDKLLKTLSYSDDKMLDVMPTGNGVRLIDAYGNIVSHRNIMLSDVDNDTFTKLTVNRCPSGYVCLTNNCMVAVLQNEDYNPIVVWIRANEIHHGYKVLQALPQPSYSGVVTIDKDELNIMALHEFYDGVADSYDQEWRRKSLYKKYSNLFEKAPVISLEVMMLIGMVLSSGRITKLSTRNIGKCVVRIPAPLDRSKSVFLDKALDDLGIGWCFKNGKTRTVGSSEQKSEVLVSDNKKLYLVLSYLIGNDTYQSRDASKIVHMTPEHDLALLYGMMLCRTSIDDRHDTGRGITAEISTHDETQFLLLYSLLMQYGVSPSVHINTMVRTNIVTTSAPVVYGIRNFVSVNEFIERMDNNKHHENNGGEYEFFEYDGTQYSVHRVRKVEHCIGTFKKINVDDNFGYVNGCLTVVGESIWHNAKIAKVTYTEDDEIVRDIKQADMYERRISRPPVKYPIIKEDREPTGIKVNVANLISDENLIDTPNGYVHPRLIHKGDLIAAANGDFVEVKNITEHDVNGDMIELQAMYLGSTFLSAETKVLAKHCANATYNSSSKKKYYFPYPENIDECDWIDAENLQYGDVVISPLPKLFESKSEIVFDLAQYVPEMKQNIYDIYDDKIVWRHKRTFKGYKHDGLRQGDVSKALKIPMSEVRNVLNGDQSPFTNAIREYLSSEDITLDEWRNIYNGYETVTINRYCKYDDDFAYLIGFYIADGCCSSNRNTMTYCLCIDDPQYEASIRKAMQNKFPGITGNLIYQHKRTAFPENRGCLLNFYFPIFTRLIKSLVPGLALDKEIPDILMHQPRHTINALLKGLTDGDGCVKHREYTYVSVSERLSTQVMRILRCNETPSFVKPYRTINNFGDNAAFACYASYSDYLVKLFDVDDRRGRFGGHRYRIIEDADGNKYFATRIRDVRYVRYAGKAYKISTNDIGYSVSSCIVMN